MDWRHFTKGIIFSKSNPKQEAKQNSSLYE